VLALHFRFFAPVEGARGMLRARTTKINRHMYSAGL
jgi:hypothetical protein